MVPGIDDAYAAASEVTLVARRQCHASRGRDARDLRVHGIPRSPCVLLPGDAWAVQQRRLNVYRQ